MDPRFKIYVEQLRDGHVEKLAENFAPKFLDVSENDLAFVDPVEIRGEAYLADDMLVLHVDVHTFCKIPCRICNEPVNTEIAIKGFYHAMPLEEIKTGVFDFQDILRETILLEVPSLVECHEGTCPQRRGMAKYFKKESPPGEKGVEEGYQPFADLDLDVPIKKSKKK